MTQVWVREAQTVARDATGDDAVESPAPAAPVSPVHPPTGAAAELIAAATAERARPRRRLLPLLGSPPALVALFSAPLLLPHTCLRLPDLRVIVSKLKADLVREHGPFEARPSHRL